MAVMQAPPTGCRLVIKNTGTKQNPIYEATCKGSCEPPSSNPCDVKTEQYVGSDGNTFTISYCTCGGYSIPTTNAQGCVGNINNESGLWKIVCVNASCTARCVKSLLPDPPPEGQTGEVFACTCPDVP